MTHSTEITSTQEIFSQPLTPGNINVISNPPRKQTTTSRLFCSKETKCKNSEATKNDLFNPSNIQKPRDNLNKNKKTSFERKKIFIQKSNTCGRERFSIYGFVE